MSNTHLTSYLNRLANNYKSKGDFGRFYGLKRASSVISELRFEVVSLVQLENIKYIGEGTKKKVKAFFELQQPIPFEEDIKNNPHKHYMPRQKALKLVTPLLDYLKVDESALMGSYRREKAMVGDIDILVTSKIDLSNFKHRGMKVKILAEGPQKVKLELTYYKKVIEVDIRKVLKSQLGSMQLYFTGPKTLNIEMRRVAKSMNLKLSEYGITDLETGILKSYRTEKSIFKALELAYVEPKFR